MVEQKKHTPDLNNQDSEWPLWEVFVQEKQGACLCRKISFMNYMLKTK